MNRTVAKSLKIAHEAYKTMYKNGVNVGRIGQQEVGTVDKCEFIANQTMIGVQFSNRYAIYHTYEIELR